MAKVTISGLPLAATLDGTELVELEQDGGSVQCTTQDIADLGGGGSYLKYVALLSQAGTAAPTATVLENTLGGTVVWSRSGTGDYTGTLSGAFTENKTWFSANCEWTTDAINGNLRRVDNNSVGLYASDSTGTLFDDFRNLSIEIRVYP